MPGPTRASGGSSTPMLDAASGDATRKAASARSERAAAPSFDASRAPSSVARLERQHRRRPLRHETRRLGVEPHRLEPGRHVAGQRVDASRSRPTRR